MRIQVTNDDGIDSEGLQELVRHLAATGHEVIVVAPDRDWSGAGAALGTIDLGTNLKASRVEIPGALEVEAWAIDGPPALTVIVAQLGAFGPPPDLVVSGINAGPNTGRSVLHSGTVGAVLTAQNFGRSGLAVSVEVSDPWRWDTAAQLAVETLDLVIDAPPRSAINLNVPAVDRSDVRGVRWSRLAPFGAVRAAISGLAEDGLQVELSATGYDPEPDTDQGAVNAGYASLTTVIGIAEAWEVVTEDAGDGSPADAGVTVVERVAAGTELHHLHRVPDASGRHALVRPRLVID